MKQPLYIIAFFAIITLSACTSISPGYEGTFSYLSGYEIETTYSPGTYLKAPWTDLIQYDIRQRQDMQKMAVLDKNGLDVNVEISVQFHIKKGMSGHVHNEIGTDYDDRFIIPQLRSVARQVIGKYTAEQLYSTMRDSLQSLIFHSLEPTFAEKYFVLEAVLVRDVNLPEQLKSAISMKQVKEQENLQMDFILQRERKEAERKLIAADAESKANNIINESLTDKVLQAQGIRATLELAKSPNTKVIVVGGTDGLPMILGQ